MKLDRAFRAFKDLADRKKEVYDEDLMAIVTDEATQGQATYELDYLHVVSGTGIIPSATVKLRKEGQPFQESGIGDGPVDAVFAAIDTITGIKGRLQDYALRAATSGKDAVGEVSVKVDFDGRLVSGKGSSTDVIEASARAGLANFASTISFGSTAVACNAFDIEGEEALGVPFRFDDEGGNACGCPDGRDTCKVVSAGLSPPPPLPPVPH